MGKKSKLKKIRKIAAEMPVIYRKAVIGSLVKGNEVTEEQLGEPVNPEAIYRQKETKAVPMNHYRRMKALYNKMGPSGVGAYYRAVEDYKVQKTMKEAESQEVENLDNQIIPNGGS